jgi:hypothetical protein
MSDNLKRYRRSVFDSAIVSSKDCDDRRSARGDLLEDTAAFESRYAINNFD